MMTEAIKVHVEFKKLNLIILNQYLVCLSLVHLVELIIIVIIVIIVIIAVSVLWN